MEHILSRPAKHRRIEFSRRNKSSAQTEIYSVASDPKNENQRINGIKIFAEIGFGLGFKTDAKAADDFYYNNNLYQTKNSDVSSAVRFTRESLILGAGVEYPLGGSTFLTGGIRFDNNFIDILKDQNS